MKQLKIQSFCQKIKLLKNIYKKILLWGVFRRYFVSTLIKKTIVSNL